MMYSCTRCVPGWQLLSEKEKSNFQQSESEWRNLMAIISRGADSALDSLADVEGCSVGVAIIVVEN